MAAHIFCMSISLYIYISYRHHIFVYFYIMRDSMGRDRSDCTWLRDTAFRGASVTPGEHSTASSPEKKQKRTGSKASKMGIDIFIIVKVITNRVCVGVEQQGEKKLINTYKPTCNINLMGRCNPTLFLALLLLCSSSSVIQWKKMGNKG